MWLLWLRVNKMLEKFMLRFHSFMISLRFVVWFFYGFGKPNFFIYDFFLRFAYDFFYDLWYVFLIYVFFNDFFVALYFFCVLGLSFSF